MSKKTSIFFALVLAVLLAISSFQVLASGITQTQGSQSIQRVVSSQGNILSFPKLYGVNLVDEDWYNWADQQIDNELSEIRSSGFNFVRLEVYFHRLVDFSSLTFSPSYNQIYYEKLVYILQSLEQHGLFVEPLLMEPWKFGNVMTMWWTNQTLRSEISFFYRSFAGWLKDMSLTNIVYITLWSEASYYYEWVDGYYVITNYLANYVQANADWRSWLNQNGIEPVNLTITNIELYIDQYISWSNTRFNEITQLKEIAVEKGWPGMLVSAEMGYTNSEIGTGGSFCASEYLNCSASTYVDILNEHDYFDSTSWAMQPYLDCNYPKTVVINELGPPFYLGVYANDTTEWWYYVEPKMDLAVKKGNGFAIWDWMDYTGEGGLWGLVDSNNNPRPILQLLTAWLANQTITYAG